MTELEDLAVKMLGTRNKQKLKTRAAETNGLIPFAIQRCRDHYDKIGVRPPALIEAEKAIMRFIEIMDGHGQVLSRATWSSRTGGNVSPEQQERLKCCLGRAGQVEMSSRSSRTG